MNGTVFIRRHARRAPWVWRALLIVLAIGLLACSSTGPPSVPTPTPKAPPTSPPVGTTLGYYDVTISAASSCSLPGYAMKATYKEARVDQTGQRLDVTWDPYGWYRGMAFTGSIDGLNIRFTLNGSQVPDSNGYWFIALVDDAWIAYSGTAAGTMDGGRIVATFDGTVRVSLGSDHTVIATCTASDHRMEMVRQ